jgi:hypothetical protein
MAVISTVCSVLILGLNAIYVKSSDFFGAFFCSSFGAHSSSAAFASLSPFGRCLRCEKNLIRCVHQSKLEFFARGMALFFVSFVISVGHMRYLLCKYALTWLCPISIGLPHPRRRRHPCPGALCAQNTAILWFSLFDSENSESKGVVHVILSGTNRT